MNTQTQTINGLDYIIENVRNTAVSKFGKNEYFRMTAYIVKGNRCQDVANVIASLFNKNLIDFKTMKKIENQSFEKQVYFLSEFKEFILN